MYDIHSIADIEGHLDLHGSLDCAVLQGIDFGGDADYVCSLDWQGAAVLGGTIPDRVRLHLIDSGALVFPRLPELPYRPYRPQLYSLAELMEGYQTGDDASLEATVDYQIYQSAQQVRSAGRDASAIQTLFQRIHDHAIDDALADLLTSDHQVVAVMGGHALQRGQPDYSAVVHLGRQLAREGYLVASGGGPGAMEAANLGAWLAPHADVALNESVELLGGNVDFRTAGYLDLGYEILNRYPGGAESLAVPTWFYGHEPTNQFASHIAKYFSNSIREDGLLALATHGVVFAPGSAGTVQEVFQDATQNHYGTFDLTSPMVFLGRDFWNQELPVTPLLRTLAGDRPYSELIGVVDTPEEAIDFLKSHPPIPTS
ncbi:MAG: hypothetical protein V3V01_20710 [Acidimicrobiales bacterium]